MRTDVCEPSAPTIDRAHVLTRRPVRELEVVIPARNEAVRLGPTLASVVALLEQRPWDSAVVVADNGSADDTADLARRYDGGRVRVDVVGCARRGKGAAIRRAFLTSQAGTVGYLDADGATPIGLLDHVMAERAAGADAVIASRHLAESHIAVKQPPVRRAGGAAFRLLTRSLVPGVADTQCGFKFFAGEAVRDAIARTVTDGFVFDVELLHHMRSAGGVIVELPTVWIDAEGSTLSPLRHGPGVALELLRLTRSMR